MSDGCKISVSFYSVNHMVHILSARQYVITTTEAANHAFTGITISTVKQLRGMAGSKNAREWCSITAKSRADQAAQNQCRQYSLYLPAADIWSRQCARLQNCVGHV